MTDRFSLPPTDYGYLAWYRFFDTPYAPDRIHQLLQQHGIPRQAWPREPKMRAPLHAWRNAVAAAREACESGDKDYDTVVGGRPIRARLSVRSEHRSKMTISNDRDVHTTVFVRTDLYHPDAPEVEVAKRQFWKEGKDKVGRVRRDSHRVGPTQPHRIANEDDKAKLRELTDLMNVTFARYTSSYDQADMRATMRAVLQGRCQAVWTKSVWYVPPTSAQPLEALRRFAHDIGGNTMTVVATGPARDIYDEVALAAEEDYGKVLDGIEARYLDYLKRPGGVTRRNIANFTAEYRQAKEVYHQHLQRLYVWDGEPVDTMTRRAADIEDLLDLR